MPRPTAKAKSKVTLTRIPGDDVEIVLRLQFDAMHPGATDVYNALARFLKEILTEREAAQLMKQWRKAKDKAFAEGG